MQVSHLMDGSHQCNLLIQDHKEYNFQVLLRSASICTFGFSASLFMRLIHMEKAESNLSSFVVFWVGLTIF